MGIATPCYGTVRNDKVFDKSEFYLLSAENCKKALAEASAFLHDTGL